ncbi:MAG: ABC transporter permease [Gemmatimonadetes bacterium]|nr:ABC transporter permease [Gemmatimonadota bacterium]
MRRSGGRPGILQDGVFALRALRRSPGFVLFTAIVIGLGVGAATAVFSVLKPLVLAPLPFEEPEELVWIANEADPGESSLSAVTSRSGNLRDFRERSRSFEGITGYNAFFEQAAYTLTGTGEPARLVGLGVAHDFLEVLGVRPLHGRGFVEEEGQWGGPRAVILTHGFWRGRFEADPGIVGRAIILNDLPRTVVGVLPATFDFPSIFTPGKHVDFLVPFPISAETDRWGNTLSMVGRLRPGVSAGEAQADLDAVIANLEREQPERWGLGAEVTPLQAHIAGPFRAALLLLATAAATLLLIVCVNVSNLMLARSPGRAREVAVRKAFGATRTRVARQLMLEALGISLAGAAFGAALAWGATSLVARTAGIQVPLLHAVRVDGWALAFAAGVAVLTGLLIGLVPALQVTEGGEASVLREASRGSSAGRGARRLRETLVVAEVSLACVLLVAGGLLVRSFRAVLEVDLGFDPANAVAWQLNPSDDFESRAEESAFYAVLTERVVSLPGVEAVGLIDALPLGRNRTWGFSVVGVPDEEDTDDPVFPHMIDPGYLEAMRIPLVAGRNVASHDTDQSPPVMLMNESGARRVFGDEDPLGRRIRLGGSEEWEVVGIVQDVRHVSPETGPGIQMYMPMAQLKDFSTMDMVVRSRLPTEQVAAAVSATIAEVDPAMPTREFWTMSSRVQRAVSARRFTLGVLSAFGAAALLLAGLGIYGVLAQSVAERRAEIGIRMALGASTPAVVRSVMGRTLVLAAGGIAVGAVLSLGSTRLLGSLLYGVSATDPATFLGMALILLLVAAVAGGLPAARAARTRGVRVLRAD